MSFGKRLRAERRTGGLFVAALVASVGMAGVQAPPAPLGASTQQAPREFVAEQPKKRRANPTVVNRAKPASDAWDSRKARRRIIMEMAGRPNTGRQWNRIHRALRHGNGAHILSFEAWKLRALQASGVRLVVTPLEQTA